MIPIAKPLIGDAEIAAVERVLRSGNLAGGPEVAAFEQEFSQFVGGGECIAVNSGTSALHLGLLAAGVGPGDEVIVPSFTFAATANSVALTGAQPVFVDIDPATFCISPDAVAAAITPRTVGIMPVHLFGQAADMAAMQSIADHHGLAVFEDAAQAHLASSHGRPVGSFGRFAAFSFYPTKNMTTGEGGMVVTGDADLARRVRLLRNQGMESRYQNEIVGFNARMTDVHAAIGRVQLRRLPAWTAARQANASFYDANLIGVETPVTAPGNVHVYHQYTIRISAGKRDRVAQYLGEHAVGTGVYYPVGTHQLPPFADPIDLPATTTATAEVLSIPVHPALSELELEQVVEQVNQAVKVSQ